jgi:putative acetyltransferase
MAFAAGDEQDVPERLRARERLTFALVIEDGGAVIGQITFSPMTVGGSDSNWFALGPVAVAPERQGEGLGSELIAAGLARLRALGAAGVALTGDPAYYRRFGFAVAPRWSPPNEPGEYFQILSLDGADPPGVLHFDPGFYG